MVHPGFRRSLRARLSLRLSSGSVAVRNGRGRVVCSRHTALGAGGTFKVIRYGPRGHDIFAAVTFVTTPRLI